MLACLFAGSAQGETCRYDGATSFNGRLAIVADATEEAGSVRVDVRLDLQAQPLPLFHTRYLMEEISTADANGVELVAVNSRYSVDGRIVRQGWDVFDRTADGLQAHRIEGKRAAEFGRQHPSFARYWAAGMFGQPWVEDFERAPPERRPDLDLRAMSPAVRPPLALAFYWVRWLPGAETVVPVFLPGFKDRKRVDLPIGDAAGPAGQLLRQAPLHYPELSVAPASTASAWLSDGRRVLQLYLDLHGIQHSARATIRALGCTGAVPFPPSGSGLVPRRR